MQTRLGYVIRFVCFCIFFTIGAGTITFSILLEPELTTYYRNRQTLAQIEAENKKIEDLTQKYQMQIDLIRQEPNLLRRLERVTFGKALQTPEKQMPPVNPDKNLQQAAKSVLAEMETQPEPSPLPDWLQRCIQPNIRISLFLAGSGLVLITFLFFGSPSAQKSTGRKFHNR